MEFETGGRPDPSGSGGSGGGTGTRPPGMSASAGNEFDYRDPVGTFVGATRGVLTRPVDFFRGMARQGDFLNPALYALICYEIYAVLGGIIGLLFGSIGSLGAGTAGEQAAGVATSFGGFIAGVVLAPFFAALILLIMAGIKHLLVILIVGSSNAGFEATLRVQSYAFATRVFWWVPILGSLAGFVYGIYLSVVGIREVHATTTGKAALVVLIPVGVVLILALLLAAVIGAAIFTLLQQQV
ncbi:hypothetical protein GBA63_09535 [Rubrobacter tropicus]|uniref:Yip1 domain-containing protein n=1 Tax=Rubrobacter tropicus TaxID=2653851 RepID=A0A6G8Q8T5_9ACTN|nr:YIP1 family protein [Rubrobacter tropicus]QIN82863.1 hypothetical protein GBA63_09535 [Rubrobacter tropicus]